MSRDKLNKTFDLGNDYYAGYFANTKIRDIEEKYIGTVIDLEALTKVSRQLDVSMGNMMGLVNGFAVMIYMIVIYLLSKIIIEKNAQVYLYDKDTWLYERRDQQAVYYVDNGCGYNRNCLVSLSD